MQSFSVSKDITEKKQAEEAAKKIEERYRILFSNINDAVFVHEYTDKKAFPEDSLKLMTLPVFVWVIHVRNF